MTYKPLPLPFDYLIPDYGLFGPVVDGLLIARQLVEHHIPDNVQYEDHEDHNSTWVTAHNDYKDKTLLVLDRRIDETKRAYSCGASH